MHPQLGLQLETRRCRRRHGDVFESPRSASAVVGGNGGSSGSKAGAAVGATFGVIIGVAAIIAAVVFIRRKRGALAASSANPVVAAIVAAVAFIRRKLAPAASSPSPVVVTSGAQSQLELALVGDGAASVGASAASSAGAAGPVVRVHSSDPGRDVQLETMNPLHLRSQDS